MGPCFGKRPAVMWRSMRMACPFCKLRCRMADGLQGRSAMISFPAGSGRFWLTRGAPLTGHSAKRTALSWTSKFGVSSEVQALLGHHTSGVTKTPLVYARDAQAAPLRELDRVLSTIRSEAFAPDMTRSGQFASSCSITNMNGTPSSIMLTVGATKPLTV